MLKIPIPSDATLQKLDDAVNQAWFDGYKSIVDPRFPDGERLPFWALTLWKELLEMRSGQKMWERSRKWVEKEVERCQKKHDEDTVMQLEVAKEILDRLPWSSTMEFEKRHTTTLLLSYYLGPERLTDSHINIMSNL